MSVAIGILESVNARRNEDHDIIYKVIEVFGRLELLSSGPTSVFPTRILAHSSKSLKVLTVARKQELPACNIHIRHSIRLHANCTRRPSKPSACEHDSRCVNMSLRLWWDENKLDGAIITKTCVWD